MIKNKIKYFITDIDGTLTDGKMYYTETGKFMKSFYAKDGQGIFSLRDLYPEIKILFLSADKSKIPVKRAEDLFVECEIGYYEKVEYLKTRFGDDCFDYMCYIGDDETDKECLELAQLSACPLNASNRIKDIDGIHICDNNGGEGAVRDFIEYIINLLKENKIETVK